MQPTAPHQHIEKCNQPIHGWYTRNVVRRNLGEEEISVRDYFLFHFRHQTHPSVSLSCWYRCFFPFYFDRIKYFPHERQIWLKYTFGLGWWIPKRLGGCVSVHMLWWWKGIWAGFKLCSWHASSFFTPPMKPYIFQQHCRKRCSLQTVKDMKGERE